MNHFYLVSYAQASKHLKTSDSRLTFKEKQARKELAFLAEINFRAVYTSQAKAALQLIAPVAKKLKREVKAVASLNARELPLMEADLEEAALAYLWHFPTESFPEGESNLVAQRRVITYLAALNQQAEGANFLLVVEHELLALCLNYYDATVSYETLAQVAGFRVVQLTLGSEFSEFKKLL